ncbi:MAG: DEAD/DEAH box helicase [Cenarchaeum symbiont of Oopsacas minuta]|nr:DEAD/DEAH box helicase [Cenarchaeum symbiont of Oopsacas minuta]
MKVAKLKLTKTAIKFLTKQGYTDLFPPQKTAISAGLLRDKSILVSAPTAGGKTLIATMAILSFLSKGKGKAVYLSPLKALAAEKYAEFKKLEDVSIGGRKPKVSISVGNVGNSKNNPINSDILILTNERMDYVIRSGSDWIDDIGLVIADEVHLVGDENRGPTLEMILTRMKRKKPRPQIIALSATVTNSKEIADWLGVKLAKSYWRPVPLIEGVCDGKTVEMNDGKRSKPNFTTRGIPVDLGIECVTDGGQSLLFASTRTRSVSLATKAAEAVSELLTNSERKILLIISKKITGTGESTELVNQLANLTKQGVAFHHAGLDQKCREIVEDGYRKGAIKLLSSTPTLAAGVNLPARRVVISSMTRYNGAIGMNSPISILEYKQLCGRAGRPQYDDHGEAIIVASREADEIAQRYIGGKAEPIESTMTQANALHNHILSLVSTEPGIHKNDVLEFFMNTLGGIQYTKTDTKHRVYDALEYLEKNDMLVEKNDRYAATEFGKKTSSLYIDPLTAWNMREDITDAPKRGSHALGFLHTVTQCREFYPRMELRQKDNSFAYTMLKKKRSEMITHITIFECNRSLLALDMWISEITESNIASALKVESGDIHRMIETACWLLFCMKDLARHLGRSDLILELESLEMRTRYGVKAQLLDLVRLRGVGRIRARIMYKRGIKTVDDLRKLPITKLAAMDKIGPKLAASIKLQTKRLAPRR